MKMEQTQCSETSAYKIQTPGNYPEASIQHSEHGENFKSRMLPQFHHQTGVFGWNKNHEAGRYAVFFRFHFISFSSSPTVFLSTLFLSNI
jgi:hypothetical protein